ncbi:MAG: 5'-nucleotidase C-terminal domain-containing protein [Gammaproteobacteria bacterium]|nr:5'-nucleotidase C-terminal domain-containing protein [Gammaproteobacteria bacterium]
MMNKPILAIVTLFLLTSCATAPPPSGGLTFIHLNDTYRVGAVEDDTAGGFSRVVTLVRDLQAQGRDVRILHGGDFLYPSLESQLWDGLQMVDAMNFLNAVAPLYAASGNHEFDRRGPEQLVAALKASEFVWVGDNFSFDTGDAEADALLRSGFSFEAGGKTVGVFSVTLHPEDGGNERSYLSIDRDYQSVARRAVEALEARGVDLIIGVTHVHMWQDVAMAQLKAEYPQLAFIVGGHEHEPQYSEGSSTAAAVMKGASNARVIWRIDVDFDAAGNYTVAEQRITVDESIPFDPEYEVIVDKWNGRLLEKFPFLEARIGTAALAMDAREEHVRSRESSWGNFIVDQMRTAFGEPAADFAFLNSGTLRLDDVVEGDILFDDIGRTFGFSSFLRHTTLTGAEFRQVMEAGYRGGPESQGYFPQISGFRVCVDRSRAEFDRIVSLQVPTEDGWAEIDPQREYTVVVPDFLYGGGDGYDIPKDRFASRPASELKYLVLDAVLRAQGLGQPVGEPVTRDKRRYHALREPKERCFN